MCRFIAIVLLIVALFVSPVCAQYPGYAPAQVYARGVGVSVSPWGYQYQTTAVPLPQYSGYANYILPQTQYQFQPYSTYYNGYYSGGLNYSFQTPSIWQGTGSFYVPYGW